ncbi:MAG TPA: aminodeoxychorismate synthase component I, partial [Planctomycetaceae bacterium]|nr:aminodeoxychorismate synthase component I [Planctomycetaceae bacterium]
LASQQGVVVLESVLKRNDVGRYSFLTADPFEFFTHQSARFGLDPFGPIRARLRTMPVDSVPGLPPFQGGAAGILGYELGGCWEQLPRSRFDEFQLPVLAVGLYDWTLAWDHVADRCWVISHGFPEQDERRRRKRAAERLAWVRGKLAPIAAANSKQHRPTAAPLPVEALRAGAPILPRSQLAPHWPVPGRRDLFSDFTRPGYLRMVERVIEYIRAGDIFQANVSQRLVTPWRRSPLALYARLRQCNPAPFAGYFACDDWAVASASPERFLHMREGEVETRPIKGTRPRGRGPEADLFARDELRESEKDVAENVMIVDLLRNDLSRVCRPGSIRLPVLCAVESYQTVQHLVSQVRGRLREDADAWSLLEAVFPGGSVTGAPKIRAMQIIAEQEPTVRGPYCGCLFYVGFDGRLDSNILIRTFVCRKGWAQCAVGGGVVAQSDPVAEYEETLHKAEGMLRALR